MNIKPTALIILDGFGYSKNKKYNAIYQANTKIMEWFNQYPSALLKASGKAVGLLKDMIGNSEVGHLTIGAGRTIKQPITVLHEAIESGKFFKDQKLIDLMLKLKKKNRTLHLMGLLSDAGVHSHEEVLYALIKMASRLDLKKIVIHAFLDGRDVPPKSAVFYLEKLEQVILKNKACILGSLHGRFYAMDRDKNWSRIKKSYDILTKKVFCKFKNWQDAIAYYYKKNITDEFIIPTAINENCYIKKDDGLIFFNLREDRARQLTQVFVDKNFTAFESQELELSWIVTGVSYSSSFHVTSVLCEKEIVYNTILDYIEKNNIPIVSISETEKYAAVTYFFDGGREILRKNETEIIIPSKSFKKTYEEIPGMSAADITNALITSLKNNPNSFFLVNFANADMVGHSGNFKSTIKAIKYLDQQIQNIFKVLIEEFNGTLYITSDHGNAEYMHDQKFKQRHTAHTINRVPFIMIENNLAQKKLNLKSLADIAPFILNNLGIPMDRNKPKKNLI